jgi:hypothetical protein
MEEEGSRHEVEATVDICFNIVGFRNLTQLYARSVFFEITVTAGDSQGAPYLIVSDKENPSSIGLLEYVSPLYSMGPLAVVSLL